jgi:3-deoxy-manno-octulosonate cytidylyltransferase (CMP-KDO synthetase)
MPRALGVIPARYASTRFPGKPLAPLGHGTLLSSVWTAASAARRLDRIVVATEDARIVQACQAIGAEAMLTSDSHVSGSDRVAEVVRRAGEDFDVVVNIQGDEPFVTGTTLDRLVSAFDGHPGLRMATTAEPLEEVEDLFDPGCVKVVCADSGEALYFSRAPIPYHRGTPPLSSDFRRALASRPAGLKGYLKHQGLYAYRPDTLLELTQLAPSPLEIDEGLEQLRALQAGIRILVLPSDFRSIAVDTVDDLARAQSTLSTRQETPR